MRETGTTGVNRERLRPQARPGGNRRVAAGRARSERGEAKEAPRERSQKKMSREGIEPSTPQIKSCLRRSK